MTEAALLAEFAQVKDALEEAQQILSEQHPQVRVEYYHCDVGSRGGKSRDTVIGVDCFYESGPSAQYGGVGLMISVEDSHTEPKVDFVGLIWTAPYADEESVVIDEATPLSSNLLKQIEDAMPTLLSDLAAAVSRGRPPSARV